MILHSSPARLQASIIRSGSKPTILPLGSVRFQGSYAPSMPMTTVFQSLAKAVGAKANAAASETPKATDVMYLEPISFPPVLALTPIARGDQPPASQNSCRRFDRSRDLVHDLADVVLAQDKRRGEFDRVAGPPDHEPPIQRTMRE